MKAPDKIYLNIIDMGSGYMVAPSIEDNGGEQYIHKDALLEWAKEKYNKAYKLHLKKGDDYAYGQGKMDAYQKLIDKLNEI